MSPGWLGILRWFKWTHSPSQGKNPESNSLSETKPRDQDQGINSYIQKSYKLCFNLSVGLKSYSTKADALSEPQGGSMALAAHDSCHIHTINNKYNQTQL